MTQARFGCYSAELTHTREIVNGLAATGEYRIKFIGPRVDKRVITENLGEEIERLFVYSPKNRLMHRIIYPMTLIVSLLYMFYYSERSRRPDVVYTRYTPVLCPAIILLRLLRIKVVSEVNSLNYVNYKANGFASSFINKIEALYLNNVAGIIAISDILQEQLRSVVRSAVPIAVVSNGANTDMFKEYPPSAFKEKIAYKYDDRLKYVGFVGHLHPWQGVDTLIEAVGILASARDDIRAVVVGGGDVERYKDKARAMGLEDVVLFTGPQDYRLVPFYISSFDVCVAPGTGDDYNSFHLRSPLKIFEYLACGKPVVSGDLRNINSLIEDNDVGEIIFGIDPVKLARSIEKHVNLSEAEKERLAQRAVKLIREMFSWQKSVAETHKFILRVVT